MRKVDTQEVRNKVVNMMGDLKGIVTLYSSHNQEVSKIESNVTLARDYKDGQIRVANEKARATARTKFYALQKHFEELAEVLRINDSVYDFSNPEFASCIALMSASAKPLPTETILGITEKFLGNRQALLALAEVAKGSNESTIRERVFNSETEIDAIQDEIISLDVGFPENIIVIPAFKDKLVKVVKACGEELSEQEKDLGVGYQDIVNMQIRAAMGL